MNKNIKYILGILVLLLVVFLSIRVENLDEYRAANTNIEFDAQTYTQNIWDTKLTSCIENAPELKEVYTSVENDSKSAFEKYGRKLGISNTHYLMLQGSGIIESVEPEFLVVAIDENTKVNIATDFIFGNAVRDGSGMVDIGEFINMTDFNNVSVAINKMIKEKVVASMNKSAQPGMNLEFSGAIELNEENIDLSSVIIIPVSAKLSDGKAE